MLTNEEVLQICQTCAKIVKRKMIYTDLCLHELENIGFIHVTSDDAKKAYSEAYYWMLYEAARPGFNKAPISVFNRDDPSVRWNFIATRRAMGRFHYARHHGIDTCSQVYDFDAVADVHDAIMKLPMDDIKIAVLYLLQGCTQQQLCKLLQLSQPTISIRIRAIKERLSRTLKAYNRR